MSAAAAIQEQARAARERLWNPPGGYVSSELEILSPHKLRSKQGRDAEKKARKTAKIERFRRLHQVAMRAGKLPLIHRRPQAPAPMPEPPLIDATCVYPLTVRDICRATCRYFDVNMLDFVSQRRHASLVRARHVAMYLSRHHTTRSLPEIARVMGGRDHTTILHGVNKIAAKLADDAELRADVAAIRKVLGIGGGGG